MYILPHTACKHKHREMAQIKLAEQIIAEKDHHLQTSEYRADLALIEKEALEEQIVVMKSLHNTSGSGSVRNSPQHDSVTPNRVCLCTCDSCQAYICEFCILHLDAHVCPVSVGMYVLVRCALVWVGFA